MIVDLMVLYSDFVKLIIFGLVGCDKFLTCFGFWLPNFMSVMLKRLNFSHAEYVNLAILTIPVFIILQISHLASKF